MSRLNLNRTPYYDDFLPEKNYLKVLFRPGRPVQARELNTIQSISQNQIEKIGNHLFVNGARISGARSNIVAKDYVRLQSLSPWIVDVDNPNGYAVDLSIYTEGLILVGQTSGISAILIKAVDAENNDPPTLYVVYTSVAIDGVTNAFIPGEIIKIYDSNGVPIYSVKVKCPGCTGSNDLDPIFPTGQGQIYNIDEGTFYFEGMFIENARQSIIVSKYGESVDYKIGFDFVQSIITSNDDISLLDNSLGYPNASSPGADRYKITLSLTKRLYSSEDGEDFILLATFKNGVFKNLKADTEYNEIMDMLAKRTYETNGDFIVNPFKLSFSEEKANYTGDPNGLFVDGDEDYFYAIISDGLAYVKGYRVETTSPLYLRIKKARDTETIDSFTKFIEEKTYIQLKPLTGFSSYPNNPLSTNNIDNTLIKIYDGPFINDSPTGTVIGTFKVYDVKPVSGTINAENNSPISVSSINVQGEIATVITATAHGVNINDIVTIAGSNTSNINGRFLVKEKISNTQFTYLAENAVSGLATGTITCTKDNDGIVCKYYITDLIMSTGKTISEGKSFVDENGDYNFKAIPYVDNCTVYNPGKTNLLWSLDRQNIKSIRQINSGKSNPPGSMNIYIRKKLSGILNANGVVTFSSFTNEYFQPFDPTSTIAIISNTNQGPEYFHMVDLSVGNRFNYTPTTITINLGATIDVGLEDEITTSGNTLTLIHTALKTNIQEYEKELAESDELTVIPTLSDINTTVSDAFAIVYAYEYDPLLPMGPNNYTNIINNLTLYKNSNDFSYNESYIKASDLVIDTDKRWKIKVLYFNHNRTNNAGFFSVDSYKTLIADEVVNYSDKLTYTASNKEDYILFNSLDFRPSIVDDDVSDNIVPDMGSTAIFDIEYYVGRKDLILANAAGSIYCKNGVSSLTPSLPTIDENSIQLFILDLNPYVYDIIQDIKLTKSDFKRYSMKDIARLERKISAIEYSTSLTLLEKSAADFSVKDVNGFDRFKNGFVVDNFKNYQAADINNTEFKASLDRKESELRPAYNMTNRKLKFLPNESNCLLLGKVALLPYEEELSDEQPFASKNISINPHFQFKKTGEMVLTPNNDVWADIRKEPKIVIQSNSGLDNLGKLSSKNDVFKIEWSAWSNVNSTIIDNNVSQSIVANTTNDSNVINNSNVIRQTRTGTSSSIDTRTESYNLGDILTDVSIQPFARSTEIQFFATKLIPNIKMYAFFDDQPVSEYTRPLYGKNGDQLITDSKGQLAGIFTIPEGKFFTGTLEFYLTNDPNNTGDVDLETSVAKATFFAGGVNKKTQNKTLNIITPTFNQNQISESRVFNDRASTVAGNTLPVSATPRTTTSPPAFLSSSTVRPSVPQTTTVNPLPLAARRPCRKCPRCANCYDPVAQTFKLETDSFITSIDLYFKDVDTTNDEIFVQIRNVVNGYPGESILAEKKYDPFDVAKSEDSTTAFNVKFDFPVFVEGNTWYCFVVGGYSPNTRIWVAKLGSEVVNIPGKIIETQPSIGSSFRSQNADTWNAEQYEDIKYKIYTARFTDSNLNLKFEHECERQQLPENPIETEKNSNSVRITVPNHGFNANDKITLSAFEDEWVQIQITSGTIQIGMKLTTLSGFEGYITDYTTDQIDTFIKLRNMKGIYSINDAFTCNQMDVNVNDNFLITKIGYNSDLISSDGRLRYNVVYGVMKSVIPTTINGIPIEQINKQHIIKKIDSMDTIVIETQSNASASGYVGGNYVFSDYNQKYELINFSGVYLPYNCDENHTYNGVIYNQLNGVLTGKNYLSDTVKTIKIGEDNYLNQPAIIVSNDNKSTGGRMINLNLSFYSSNMKISPMVNIDTFNLTAVGNRVQWITSSDFNVKPNATNRFKLEASSMYGSDVYKYVTKTINLKNPATTMLIILDVFNDVNSDFDIWVKAKSPLETNVLIDDKRWMKIIDFQKNRNSADLTDYTEIEINTDLCNVEYYTTDTNFTVYPWSSIPGFSEFNSFKLKIVGKSKNSAKPPLFKNLRIIAAT